MESSLDEAQLVRDAIAVAARLEVALKDALLLQHAAAPVIATGTATAALAAVAVGNGNGAGAGAEGGESGGVKSEVFAQGGDDDPFSVAGGGGGGPESNGSGDMEVAAAAIAQ